MAECPIWSKNPRDPKTLEKPNAYDLGHSRLYDPIFAMKDAHVQDETGCVCGNDPYFVQFDKVNEKGYPWNFEIPGKGPASPRGIATDDGTDGCGKKNMAGARPGEPVIASARFEGPGPPALGELIRTSLQRSRHTP